MVSVIARYHVPSLFSARALTANAFSARTLLCPTPAMLKLGVLSVLLRRDGGSTGQQHLDWLAPLPVAWAPPALIAVSAATVRVWKEKTNPNAKTQIPGPLDMMAGMREYAHLAEPLVLGVSQVPEAHRDDLTYGLTHLRALGNAESLVQSLGPPEWVDDLPEGFVPLTTPADLTGDVAALLDDLGSAPRFERLSAYRAPGASTVLRLGDDRRRVLVRLPFRIVRQTADGYLAERIDA